MLANDGHTPLEIKMADEERRLVTADEAGEYLNIRADRFRRYVKKGYFPDPVIPGRWDLEHIKRSLDARAGTVG